MAYFDPYVDASGLHYPSYEDIRNNLIASFRGIYGDDAYLEPDSQDYELISVFADKTFATMQLAALAYNNRSPSSAIRGGLTGIVKVNGIQRKEAGYSFAKLEVVGTPGTVITGGIAADKNKIMWRLDDVTIGAGGSATTNAVCSVPGQVYADAGDIHRIMTPQAGWVSVRNPAAAIVGNAEENDAQLRARQKISVARPSRTVLLGTLGGIAELPDVTRYKVYENDTNIPDANGVPGHSICAVVEGGADDDIASEIYYRKTPGCGTYGDIAVAVTSETHQRPMDAPPIRFFRPRYVDVGVHIRITPLDGYVNRHGLAIIDNVVAYLNSLEIGADLTISALYSPILSATPDITNPAFYVSSLMIGVAAGELHTDNVAIPFNAVTRGVAENITLEVV